MKGLSWADVAEANDQLEEKGARPKFETSFDRQELTDFRMQLKPFSREQLLSLKSAVRLISTEKTLSSYLAAVRSSGQILDKMVLIGQPGASKRVKAMLDLLDVALELSHTSQILLVESCRPDGLSVFFDIDLMTLSGVTYHYIDVTSVTRGRHMGGIIVAPETSFKTRYSVLKSKPLDHVSYVVGLVEPNSVPDFEIDIPSQPCRIPFDQLDKLASEVSDCSKDELEECIQIIADSIPDQSKDFAKSGPRVLSYKGNFLKALSENSEESQLELQNFWEHLKEHQRAFFSVEFSKKLDHELKPMCRIPYSESGPCEEFTPFMSTLDSSLAYAASLCIDDKLHPTEEEWARCSCSDPFVGSFQMRRVPDQNGNFDERVFSLNNSWVDLSYSSAKVHIDRKYHDLENCDGPQLEKVLSESLLGLLRPCEPSASSRFVEAMIEKTYSTDDLSLFSKKILTGTLYRETHNILMDYYDMIGDLSRAVLSSYRSFRYHKGTNLIKFSKIEGRPAYVINGMTELQPGLKNQTAAVIGRLVEVDSTGYVIARHRPNRSAHFNISPEDLDWWPTLWSKALSWLSLVQLQEIATDSSSCSLENDILGMLLLLSNDEPFSQLATSVRFMYINITGFGTNLADIYKKLDWYKPSNFAEALFGMRSLKMTTFGLLSRSRGITPWMKGTSSGAIPVHRTGMAIAMPHQRIPVNSMNYVYNSFYLGKFLEYIRSNTIQKEASVLIKMIDNHLDYIQNHKICDADIAFSDMSVVDKVKSLNYTDAYGGHQVSAVILTISVEISKRKISAKSSLPLDLSLSVRQTKVSDGFNSRGSVADRGHSICPDSVVGLESKKKALTQVSKCYLTLAQNMLDFRRDYQTTRENLDAPYNEEGQPQRVPEPAELTDCLRSSDVAVNVIAYNQFYDRRYVARIFAKPEPGSRDIAILNSPMRLGCLLLENMARGVQDWERRSGDNTNLIEQPDKDEVAMRTYMKVERSEKLHFFDNEDHSSWGPKVSLEGIYLALTMRADKTAKSLIRSIISSFNRKVSKIPEKLQKFSDQHRIKGENVVSEALRRIRDGFPGYHRDWDCFETPEGMYQGTLGCCSSVLASDIHRLTTLVLERIFVDEKLEREGHLTSDDWCTAYTFSSPGEMGMYQRVRRCTDVTNQIALMASMKRNIVKSTPSGHVMELNSNFYTREGPQKPAARARLSYSVFTPEGDLAGSAMAIVSQMSEYLRSESSVIGASWIGLIGALNHSNKFGLRSVYARNPLCFSVPLEVGGLPNLDPLQSVSGMTMLSYIKNYRNGAVTARMMSEINPNPTISEMEEDMKSAIPVFSRFGVTNLSFREKRGVRLFRELLLNAPREFWIPAAMPGRGSHILKVILGCLQRQEAIQGGLSQKEIQLTAMVNKSSKVFRVDSNILKPYLGDLTSLKEMVDFWPVWQTIEMIVLDEQVSVSKSIIRNEYCLKMGLELEREHQQLLQERRRIKPIFLEVSNPPAGQAYFLRDYNLSHEVELYRQEFRDEFLPLELGGRSTIHPLMYLESLAVLNNRLRKSSRRVQKFWFGFASSKADRGLVERLISSNFCEGSRLEYSLHGSRGESLSVPVDQLIWIIEKKGLIVNKKKPIVDVTKSSIGSAFDISNLMQLCRQFDFMSRTEMTSIIGAVQTIAGNDYSFYLDFSKMSISDTTEKYKNMGTKYEFRRKLSPHENYFMTSFPLDHGWKHHIINLGETEFPDGKHGNDEYDVAKLEVSGLQPVKLSPIDGMIWLMCHELRVMPICIDPLLGTTVFTIHANGLKPAERRWLSNAVTTERPSEVLNYFIEPKPQPIDPEDSDELEEDLLPDFDPGDLIAQIRAREATRESRDISDSDSETQVEEEVPRTVSSRYLSGIDELQYERALDRRSCWMEADDEGENFVKIRMPIQLAKPPEAMTWKELRDWVESQIESNTVWLKDYILRSIRLSNRVSSFLQI